jgi:uncharacterized hydrophobic protein (TIGR00341 family)
MRLIRTLVLEEEVDSVSAVLDEHNIDYVLVHEAGKRDDQILIEFPLPTQAVESIMEDVREAKGGPESYTVVSSAESVTSTHIDELEERFVTGTEEDDSIATEEIRSTALDMTPSPQTYYSMTFLSALVATAGLLLDSPAVVVGSMVIAPLVGSALTSSVGTVLDDQTMMLEGFKTQFYGLVLAILGAAAFSFFLKSAAFLPATLDVTTTQQIAKRISPGLLSVVIGLCAGAAGSFGLATGVSVSLVGVMIAAALIPAAAAVGVGIAWGIPTVAAGASLLLLLNIIAIHVSGATVLWYLGYRPDNWTDTTGPRLPRQRALSLLVTALVLGSVFVGAGALVATHVTFEQQANQAAGEVLDEERYEPLELSSVTADFNVRTPVTSTESQEVTVVVSRPANQAYPRVSQDISQRIAAESGRDVTVVVEFVERQEHQSPG